MTRAQLEPGATINNTNNNYTYTIHECIGCGGTVIAYRAERDDKVSVIIKECCPLGIERGTDENSNALNWDDQVDHEQHMKIFKDAYERMKEIHLATPDTASQPMDYFEANNTAYVVVDSNNTEPLNEKEGLELPQVLRIIQATAGVISKYHEMGFLHLDIKPSNICVFKNLEIVDQMVLLIDFNSIRTIVEVEKGTLPLLSSPGFAAPEQDIPPQRKKIGTRTDIYGLGATLFWLLFKRYPECQDRMISSKWNQDYENSGLIQSPCNPELLKKITDFFHRTLAVTMERRYETCGDLITAIDEMLKIVEDDGQIKEAEQNILEKLDEISEKQSEKLNEVTDVQRQILGRLPEENILSNVKPEKKENIKQSQIQERECFNSKKQSRHRRVMKILALSFVMLIAFICVCCMAQPAQLLNGCFQRELNLEGGIGVGDVVEFGTYIQEDILPITDDFALGFTEPIEWLVLDVNDDCALLLSKYALDCVPYDEGYETTVWDESNIRQWLNTEFIDKAFSRRNQKYIIKDNIESFNNKYENLKDKIFLLSAVETSLYFSSDEQRMCEPTRYAGLKGAKISRSSIESRNGKCRWWLKETYGEKEVFIVNYDGHSPYITKGNNNRIAVRPALWVKITGN